MLVAFRPTSVLVDSSATKRGAYRPGPVKRLKHFFVCSAILIVIAFFVLFVNDKRFAKRMAPILVSPADGGILARGKMATTVTAEEEIELLKASEEEENVQPGAGNVQLTAVNDVTQRTFTSVYNRRLWGGFGEGSGLGSEVEPTLGLRKVLKNFVEDYGMTSMIDLPCGAMVWTNVFLKEDMKKDFRYHGGDIVASVVEKNAKTWANDPYKTFSVWDLTRTPILPGFDFILCRDALQHLPYEMIFEALHMFSRSKAKYLLVGSYSNGGNNVNMKTWGANFFEIDLKLLPFNLKPDKVFHEAFAHKCAGCDKYLYLYRISELKKVLNGTTRSS